MPYKSPWINFYTRRQGPRNPKPEIEKEDKQNQVQTSEQRVYFNTNRTNGSFASTTPSKRSWLRYRNAYSKTYMSKPLEGVETKPKKKQKKKIIIIQRSLFLYLFTFPFHFLFFSSIHFHQHAPKLNYSLVKQENIGCYLLSKLAKYWNLTNRYKK